MRFNFIYDAALEGSCLCRQHTAKVLVQSMYSEIEQNQKDNFVFLSNV